ncbi:MAG: hypothetical protein PHV34_01805 [Verrucomicrobiae bacterium]|nr:hypothetical protein [Verrucomicrobiae bacterium]
MEIIEDFGGQAKMTVVAVDESPSGSVSIVNQQPTYEIEWVAVDKKLLHHPMWQSETGYPLTEADRDAIAEWESQTSATKRAEAYAKLGENAKVYADKIDLGIESYTVYSPVARKTSCSWEAPTTGYCGKMQTPQAPSFPTGYVWVKTADRSTRTGRNGKWERVEEWTGAEWVDSDLYPDWA